MISLRRQFNLLLSFSVLALSLPSHAYLTTLESGRIPGPFEAGILPQIRLSDGAGFNIAGVVDSGIDQETSVRAVIGGGKNEFFTSVAYKWIPIPDFDSQPAIGAKFEGVYLRDQGENTLGIRAHPLVSKDFETDFGKITPFASIPLGWFTGKDTSFVATQIVAGSEWTPPDYPQWNLAAELGINASRAFSYIAAVATYRFEVERRRK